MPQLIRTVEDIFRAERQDVYALHFLENKSSAIRHTWHEMQSWFERHIPDSPTETMGPSEHSGWIEGGPSCLRIAFTPMDLKRFCDEWEYTDGSSKDPRFQCCMYPYQAWWEKHGHYCPTAERPSEPGVSVWIESPLGILSHVICDRETRSHPATARDLWANACQQWPQLRDIDFNQLHYGQVVRMSEPDQWLLTWNESIASMMSEPSRRTEADWRKVADWLRLPHNTPMTSEF